ncbi:MAG: hypothetical protein IKU24_05750, partial [Clostridia bacterium]|nr:hypothetical protein [Clostridia bacterium]
DAVGTFETSGELDDHGLDSANHQTQFNKVLSECGDIEDIYALFRKECDPNTRMLWYETGTEPVGAFGSSSISSTALKGYIFGDNCSDAAFIGWEGKVKDGEKIKTGVTFGDNVLYVDNTATKSVVRVAASGYLMGQNTQEITDEEAENMTYHASGAEGVADIRPIQVEPSLTIDGSGTNIFNISVKLGRAPSDATIYLKKGSVNMIYGDNCSVQSGETEGQEEYFYGDMNVVITGGSLRAVNMLYDSYLTGDLNLTVKPVDGSIGIEKYLRGLFGGGKIVGGCTGDVTFDVQGITLADGLHAGGGSGKVTNIVKDVTFTNSSAATIFAVRCGAPSSIENYLENVVIPSTGSSYMGAYENEVGGNIKNTFKNCTIAGNLFCGNYSGNIKGNIENTFIGGTYGSLIYDDTGKKTGTCNTYGGTEKTGYTVLGSITNKIKGASFEGDWFYGGNSAASFAENSNLTYRIINEIDGASFIRYAGGSASSTTDKIIKNTISGDQTKFTTGFYCGSNSSPVNETENYFKAKMTGYPSGGSNGGKANRVVNYIEDGADLEGFYAAANGGSATLVQNFIRGGKIGEFIGGSRTGTMNGSVENTVTGGKITKFYGGGNSSTVTSATTTISGGEFYESISKGGKTGAVTTASLAYTLGANPIGFYGTFTLENLSGSGVIQVGKDA